MRDFELGEEHQLLARTIHEWGRREVAPKIKTLDREHRFDRELILGGMTRIGLLGISVPEEYGGAGMDYVSLGWPARSSSISTPRCASSCRSIAV